MTQATQPELFWQMIDWAVRGAAAVLLFVLTLTWKDYRQRMNELVALRERIAVLEAEVKNIKNRKAS